MSVTKTLNGCNMDTLKCFVHNSFIQILTLYQLCHSHLVRVHAADKAQRLRRGNILHAQEAMLATTSVSRYTHFW